MRRVINILLSFLFSITLFVTMFSFTVLNKNFIYRNFKNYDYYNKVYINIKNDIKEYDKKLKYELSKKDVENDIKTYVKKRYDNTYFVNKIETDNNGEKLRDIYNKNIRFNNYFINKGYPLYITIIYFVNILLIIITGIVFKKTRYKHDLFKIMVYSFIFSIIFYISSRLMIDLKNELLSLILYNALKIYLGVNIILFEFSIFKKYKKRIMKS